MNNKTLTLFLIIIIPSFICSQGTYTSLNFHSVSLDTSKTINVYLPPSYNANDTIKYPVIYYLHGAQGDQNSDWFIKDTLNSMINSGRIKPIIVVKPDGSAPPYFGSFYTNSELYGKYEDYIVYDLINFIDSTFKTISAKNRRAIMGHSMGGFGCMQIALKHPELFCVVASHSGPLDFSKLPSLTPRILSEAGGNPPYSFSPSNGSFTKLGFSMGGAFSPNLLNQYYVDFLLDASGNIIDSTYQKWMLHSPARLARNYSNASNLSIYFDCGTLDELGLYSFNTAFRDTLNSLNIPNTFKSFIGFHSLQLSSRIPVSLKFIDTVFQQRILPVELNSFSAILHGNSVILKWKTTTEMNNLGFEIQREENNKWISKAFIKGMGNSLNVKDYFYEIKAITGNNKFRLKQIDQNGEFSYSEMVNVDYSQLVSYELLQNFPNPFNPETVIRFSIPVKEEVSLFVYNILGRKVKELVKEIKDEGSYRVNFNGEDLASGVYFYILRSNTTFITRKMLLLK